MSVLLVSYRRSIAARIRAAVQQAFLGADEDAVRVPRLLVPRAPAVDDVPPALQLVDRVGGHSAFDVRVSRASFSAKRPDRKRGASIASCMPSPKSIMAV